MPPAAMLQAIKAKRNKGALRNEQTAGHVSSQGFDTMSTSGPSPTVATACVCKHRRPTWINQNGVHAPFAGMPGAAMKPRLRNPPAETQLGDLYARHPGNRQAMPRRPVVASS